jgi:predicted nucleotidyltransferase
LLLLQTGDRLQPHETSDEQRGEGIRIMALRIRIPDSDLVGFCKRWKVARLAVFGSALRDDFGPESDVDLLVDFTPGAQWSLFDLVGMEEELQTLLGREVDLVERAAIEQSENYIRRRNILANTKVLYESR